MNLQERFETCSANPQIEGVIDIAPNEVWKKREDLTIIDVREVAEFNGELGHVPGAKLIVMNTVPNHLEELPTDKPIVFVCRSGARSGNVTAFCMEKGFKNVMNMKGGMLLWNQLMLPKN